MPPDSRRDVFQAIADPTRRQIINLVAHQPMNLKTITEYFDISRPAISQQIKILNECGLIEIKKEGRETFCAIRPGELKKIAEWVEQYQGLWESRLNSFEAYLTKLQSVKKKKHGKSK